MEYGLSRGLAQNLGFDQRVADLRYQQEATRRAENESAAAAKLFADDLDYQNANNSFDNPVIKEYAKSQIQKIGEFVRNNPDYKTNIDKLSQLNLMKKDLKSNEHVIRGVASDGAYKQYLQDNQEVAKNPNAYNKQAYNNINEQWNNYLKYGNQGGAEAAKLEGAKAFVYTKPAEFTNLVEQGNKLGNSFADVKLKELKNGRAGAWETEANENTLNKDAQAFYAQHKEQFDQQHPEDPIGAAKEFIRSGIHKQFNWGDTHLQDELFLMRKRQEGELNKLKLKAGASGGKPVDFYMKAIYEPGSTVEDGKRLAQTFGARLPHFIVNNKGDKKIDNSGDIFNYAGPIEDRGYKSDGKYKKDGWKVVDGFAYKDLDFGKNNDILVDPGGPSGDPKLLNEKGYKDFEINPDWADKVEIFKTPVDENGESRTMLKFKVNGEVDAKGGKAEAYRGAYNKLFATTKQRDAYGQMEDRPSEIIQNGYKYTLNPETGEYE